jgi:hypothetical protein
MIIRVENRLQLNHGMNLLIWVVVYPRLVTWALFSRSSKKLWLERLVGRENVLLKVGLRDLSLSWCVVGNWDITPEIWFELHWGINREI